MNLTLNRTIEWEYGPLFEVHLAPVESDLRALPLGQIGCMLAGLGVEGLWRDEDQVGHSNPNVADPRGRLECTYGLWHLGSSSPVGVKVFADPDQLFLWCPPGEIERLVKFPWYQDSGWVTPSVLQLHRLIIARCIEVHRRVPLRAVLIQEEGWTYCIHSHSRGILVHPDVAQAGGFQGQVEDELFAIPLE